ncbi:MAG: YcxB family protein [Limisphaerales bacterium]
MNTKIEYQLSPEQAETLAAEQAILMASTHSRKLRAERWMFPIFLGILVATFFALGDYVSQSKKGDFSRANTITAAVVGLAIGLFYGWFAQVLYDSATRKKRLNHIKKQGRIFYEKMGPRREISWDSASVVVSSKNSESKIKWQIIDRFVNRENCIHAFIGSQIAFSLPKAALSQDLTPEELIKVWEGYLSKAPKSL